MCVTRDPRLFARTDLSARAGVGNAYAGTDVDAYGVPYPLPYLDLDSNAAATHQDADPHGQPHVDADGYAHAHEYANGRTNEGADAGVSRHPYPTGGALRHDVTQG